MTLADAPAATSARLPAATVDAAVTDSELVPAASDTAVAIVSTPTGVGYWIVCEQGRVAPFGDARSYGDLRDLVLSAPIVGAASTPSGLGYWLAAADGGVFAFGDAAFLGSMGGRALNAPITGITTTASGNGYWLLASDGGVFAFGDATFHGSMGGTRLNQPVVGGTATASGRGYWLVAADGGVFAFGDAVFAGSTGSMQLNRPIRAMSPAADGQGYRMIASDGGVFSFVAPYYGNALGAGEVVSMASRPQGDGYWALTGTGQVVARGAAPDLGSLPRALSDLTVSVTAVFTGLESPIDVAVRPGDEADAVYVALRAGRIVRLVPGNVAQDVLTIPGITTTGERGLLGIAFSADGALLYVAHTDAGGDVNVVEYTMSGLVADAGSRRLLLTVEHSAYANHNGGAVELGPDGLLYIGVGDGGGADDPFRTAQDPASLLGKILRIDPRPSGLRPYTVPAGNPYGNAVWAVGLRNPWRFSFDPETGDLWIGDVGQGRREEIDLDVAPLDAGRNYGWSLFEGSLPQNSGTNPGDLIAPLAEYGHDGGNCAITGGVVVRGPSALSGAFVYADVCSGRVAALREQGGAVIDEANITTIGSVVAFAQDGAGTLYAVSLGGTISAISAT